jgi:hypothetical protein
MYCPRCGQQQISAETKFCSRCGFQMGLVSELIANNGFLPQLQALYNQKPRFFTRKNGVIFTTLWFIFWVMMVPAFFGIANEDDAAGVSAVFGLFTSLMLLIFSLGVLKKSPKAYQLPAIEMPQVQQPQGLYGAPAHQVLPPQQTQPAQAYTAPQGAWRTPDTGELTRTPGSVTETTTKLLNRDE